MDRSPRPDRSRTVLVLCARAGVAVPVAVRVRPWDRLLARLRSWSLDHELAEGCPADTTRLRSVRAASLIGMRERGRLADYWDNLVRRAQSPAAPLDRRIGICSRSVIDAEPEIRRLTARLRGSAPVSAQGVAMAELLLTSGNSPIYRLQATAPQISSAVRAALGRLDPAGEAAPGW